MKTFASTAVVFLFLAPIHAQNSSESCNDLSRHLEVEAKDEKSYQDCPIVIEIDIPG